MAEKLDDIQCIPLTALSSYNQMQEVAYDLTSSVRSAATGDILYDRHLRGVILRHQNEADSLDALYRAQQKMEAGKMAAYALLRQANEYDDDRWVGMGTILPRLPLRRPTTTLTGLLPAKLTRKSDLLARNVTMQGPNVTAWVDAAHMEVGTLAPLYKKLAEEGGEGSWTIEPGPKSIAGRAIQASGMTLATLEFRYDDNESGLTPPLSLLYKLGSAAASEEV
jgi:hypothetical protein